MSDSTSTVPAPLRSCANTLPSSSPHSRATRVPSRPPTHDSAPTCPFPRELFRFQRRASFRVRPLVRTPPLTRFQHPQHPTRTVELRVLDVSIGGVALFLPADVPPLAPGTRIPSVLVDLDAETRFHTVLRVAHVTGMNDADKGVRIGCEMESMNGESLRSLQRFIDQTQKQRRMMALDE